MKQKYPLLAAVLFAVLLIGFRVILDFLPDNNVNFTTLLDYTFVGAIAAVPMYFFFKSQLLKTEHN